MAEKTKPPVNLKGMYERLSSTMDALLEQKITPEHGNAIANVAEKLAIFARLETQIIDLALSNERALTGSGFMPAIEDDEERPKRLPRRMKVVSG